ncbi:MAG: alkaline phosphatase family protein, partial [Candidatus Bathyarchaeota archaeon]
MTSEKVVLIGFDGLPYDVVSSLPKNRFPTFNKILKEGCHGVLTSTIPPSSPTAWTSLVTGKSPGKHCVFGFSHVSKGVVTPQYSWVGRFNPVWDILSNMGKKVVILNVPFTYPPYKVNGILITGFPSPMNRIESFPPTFVDQLKSKIENYDLDVPLENEDYADMDEEKFLEGIYRITEARTEATFHLMENYDWDFFFVVFTSLDRLQHVYYGYYDEKSPLHDNTKRKILLTYYAKMDEILDNILSTIDKKTFLIIISDHGFDYVHKSIGLNNLLSDQGFLERKKNRLNRKNLKILWEQSGLIRKIIRKLPVKIARNLQTIIPSKVNYSKSKAYIDYSCTITLKKGLQPQIREDLKNEIVKYLHSVKDSETNDRIFDKVYTKEEIFSETSEEIPEIFFLVRRGYQLKRWTEKPLERIKRPSSPNRTIKTGDHPSHYAQRGFFSITGEPVKKNFISNATILDITPTILHIFDVP